MLNSVEQVGLLALLVSVLSVPLVNADAFSDALNQAVGEAMQDPSMLAPNDEEIEPKDTTNDAKNKACDGKTIDKESRNKKEDEPEDCTTSE